MKKTKDIYKILEILVKAETIDIILYTLEEKKTTKAKLVNFLRQKHNTKRSTAYEMIKKLEESKILTLEQKKYSSPTVKVPREIKKLTLQIIKTIGKYRVETTYTKIKKIYQGPKTAYVIETKRNVGETYTPYVILEPD